MHIQATLSSATEILPLRTRYREEMQCQIVHDLIHQRPGWTLSYLFRCDGVAAGFGSIAIAGPWKGKPTVFEFYILPEHRAKVFDLFETFVASSGARFFETQSNDVLQTVMIHTYGHNIGTEKIVFHDHTTTAYPANGALIRPQTPEAEVLSSLEQRRGGGEWSLEFEGKPAAKGGILFHYNRPYGDIYYEVAEPFRRRGLATFLVQELKRICYELGAIPCARCNTENIASRRTLLRAGFVPFAHILFGSLRDAEKKE